MKKNLSIILSLTLLLSMSVTAFAESTTSGEQKISVDIPTPCYDYTLHIPADCKIDYNKTEPQSIGTFTVTSDYWDNILADYKSVYVEYEFNNYMTTADGSDKLYCYIGNINDANLFDPMVSGEGWSFKHDGGDVGGFSTMYLKVPDWSIAKPGASYSMKITYTSWLLP